SAQFGSRRRFHSRPAADLSAPLHSEWASGPLGLEMPHRLFAAESLHLEILGKGHSRLSSDDVFHGGFYATPALPHVPHSARHRPAIRQELRAFRRRADRDSP